MAVPAKLNKSQICSYIQDGINIELKVLELEKLYRNLSGRISSTDQEIRKLNTENHDSRITDSDIQRERYIAKRAAVHDSVEMILGILCFIAMSIIPVFVAWFVFVCWFTTYQKSWNFNLVRNIYWGLYFGFFALMAILLVGDNIQAPGKKKKEMEENQAAANQLISRNQAEIRRKEGEKNQLLSFQSRVSREISEMKKIRSAFYGKGVINSSYRDMMSLAILQHYLETGQAYTLTGPGGAYRMLEQDSLQRQIIDRLDLVNSRLSDIADSIERLHIGQDAILSAIRGADDRAYQAACRISSQIEQSNYLNEVNRQELRYQSRLQEWNNILLSVR